MMVWPGDGEMAQPVSDLLGVELIEAISAGARGFDR